MTDCVYCNFDRDPELKTVEMYTGKDKEGCPYYYLDIERPSGCIPEPWRNKRLYIRYCPLCGRKLNDNYDTNYEHFVNQSKEDLADSIADVVFESLRMCSVDVKDGAQERYERDLIEWFEEEYVEEEN